ncbi:MAG: DUF4091 domain-containing protein [Armatimonadota bacterium]
MSNAKFWLQSSIKRVYPGSKPKKSSEMSFITARNEQISFQACVRNNGDQPLQLSLEIQDADGLGTLIRRVGYVPLPHLTPDVPSKHIEGLKHLPGLVPDPLYPGSELLVGSHETQAFWVTVSIPAEIEPGVRTLNVQFMTEDTVCAQLAVVVDTRPLVVKRTSFPLIQWFYADSLCDWYGLEPYEERFWPILEAYVRDLVQHGCSSLYVPIITPPTDGIKRPHQLLKVTETSDGQYEFDFTDVEKWVDIGLSQGSQYFEWTHWFWQWGVKWALRVYRSNADRESLLWPHETPATSDTYRNFLSQLFPVFKQFLDRKGIADRSFFHVSDEPHGEEHMGNYKTARQMLLELAPWMKVMDALSEVEYGKQKITDMPVPSIGVAHEYAEAGIPSWVYYCCGPRGKYLNRFLDTPLTKIRMHGWLFRKLGALGFLHWGYNYWYAAGSQKLLDPFVDASANNWPGWSYGDPFVVYPGEAGPIDSIRWEVFGESLRDYALLETAGVQPDDPMFDEIKGYAEFPFSEKWIAKTRRKIIERSM